MCSYIIPCIIYNLNRTKKNVRSVCSVHNGANFSVLPKKKRRKKTKRMHFKKKFRPHLYSCLHFLYRERERERETDAVYKENERRQSSAKATSGRPLFHNGIIKFDKVQKMLKVNARLFFSYFLSFAGQIKWKRRELEKKGGKNK